MTLSMPDSITPGNMPMGYPAYLGYVDGDFPTADRLPVLFPGARILTLTVTGETDGADGCDQENGDLGPNGAAMWLKHQLLSGKQRPVLYASRDNVPLTLSILAPFGVAHSQLRILSAHYEWQPGGAADHICGPGTCGAAFHADGTQWTSAFPGIGGSVIDMSTLAGDFFGDWVFTVCRSFGAVGAGPHSARFTWDSPGTPAPEGVDHYELTVRHEGSDVATPAEIPKGVNPEAYQWDNLVPGTSYEALVRAVAVNGHASPWAAVTFTTAPG